MINENEKNTTNNVFLDNIEVTYDQLDERLRNLKNNEKIVETSNDSFQTVTRMHGLLQSIYIIYIDTWNIHLIKDINIYW